MKFNQWIVGLAAIAVVSLAVPSQAQNTTTVGTNGVSVTTTNTSTPPPVFADASFTAGVREIGQAISTSTNWVVFAGYGHTINGVGRNVAFADVGYNFNDYVGMVLGYDYLWGNGGKQFNSVRGGMTLQLPMHPFAFIGTSSLTNLVVTPLVFEFVATAQGSSAVANVAGGGIDFNLYAFGKLEIHAGVDYETRTGSGSFDGNYALGHIALSRNF
jgi:hypothetical protein